MLKFQSLFHPGQALSFPCDPSGEVDLDALGEQALDRYLLARALLGRDYAYPVVVPVLRSG